MSLVAAYKQHVTTFRFKYVFIKSISKTEDSSTQQPNRVAKNIRGKHRDEQIYEARGRQTGADR